MSYRTMRGTNDVHSDDERKPWFNPRPVNVGFVADKVTLGQVFLRVLLFSPVTNTPNSSNADTMLSTDSFIIKHTLRGKTMNTTDKPNGFILRGDDKDHPTTSAQSLCN